MAASGTQLTGSGTLAKGGRREFAEELARASTEAGGAGSAALPAAARHEDRPPPPVATRIGTLEFLSFCVPFVGTALAAYKICRIHLVYLTERSHPAAGEEGAPATPRTQSVVDPMQSNLDIAQCFRACIISTLFSAVILYQYLAIEASALILGALALATAKYIGAVYETDQTVFMIPRLISP
jgi:hypothetical protein